jgi:hypothetical protein
MIQEDDSNDIVDTICEEESPMKIIDKLKGGEPSKDIGWQ